MADPVKKTYTLLPFTGADFSDTGADFNDKVAVKK